MAISVDNAPRRIGEALSPKLKGIACAPRRASLPFDAHRKKGAETRVRHSSAVRPICGLKARAQALVNGIDFTTVADIFSAPTRGNLEGIDAHWSTSPLAEAFSISLAVAASSGLLPFQSLKPDVNSWPHTASVSYGQSPCLGPKLRWLAIENSASAHVAGGSTVATPEDTSRTSLMSKHFTIPDRDDSALVAAQAAGFALTLLPASTPERHRTDGPRDRR